MFEKKFGFKLDGKQVIQGQDKGNIYIYYNSSTNKRKLKLRWNEEEMKWKIVSHAHSINRLGENDFELIKKKIYFFIKQIII